ncbi:hypothetical protein LCGC14_1365780 [marine sediment metagenome]|uniref:Uncharacterized protein n=1 Tax=marine sediment metagenome TaxID=412755 RepID=A0A0F9K7C8_9ZZZZ
MELGVVAANVKYLKAGKDSKDYLQRSNKCKVGKILRPMQIIIHRGSDFVKLYF